MHGEAAAGVVAAAGVRLCALGADASVLEAAGYAVDVVPSEPSTLGLVRELEQRDEAAGARVLCPVPDVGGASSDLVRAHLR